MKDEPHLSASSSLDGRTGERVRKAIFLDVDDTLYDHLSPMREALAEELRLPSDFPYERAYYLFRYYSDLLSDREGLSASPDKDKIANMQKQRFMLMLADLGITIDDKQAGRLQSAYLARQFAIRPFEGAVELIAGLSRQGHLVGLITNGAGPHQMKKIEALQMEGLIPKQRIFVSGVVGMAKPDPGLFAYVNRVTETKPEHSIYVGDSWRNDVAGSLGAGWTSIWFNHRRAEPESGLDPHHVVSSYAEISRILLGDRTGE
ncbi:HAD family hydrolase [Paenibacillus physcomitrellae]|uniref:Hydrolase n=1 Tax=Paenibacillus physcomitrellae TaxID=1619311 RepID=A0ABQ1FQQ7_9BACL|nr:HAD family hydrolase [Paenibacillus physcomitrellae]GGA27001.1 hydrolase [Paenibacillus physcomitrellae]